jgi:hypothetical protein
VSRAASVRPYPGSWSRHSAALRVEHPWCDGCGIRADQLVQDANGEWGGPRLTVNHKNGDTTDWWPDNLEVLCDSCHGALTPGNFTRC